MRPRSRRLVPLIAAGLIVSLAWPSASGIPAAPASLEPARGDEEPAERILRVGDTTKGDVTAESEFVHAPVNDGSYAAPVRGVRFTLEVDREGPVTIDLRSHFFDAYLVLREADGEVIAEDDDGLVNTQSRIVASLEPGRHFVFACALDGDVGPFALDVRAGQAAPLEGGERSVAEIEDARMRVEAWEAVDPDGPRLMLALSSLAAHLTSQGRHDEAELLHIRLQEICESVFGDTEPITAAALRRVANLYRSQSRYGEAEPLFVRSLEIFESQLGASHRSTVMALDDLAGLYFSQGRYGEAEPLMVRGLEIVESVHGASHPETATSLNNLGMLYQSQGRYAAAEPVLARALEIRESQLGESDPSTANSRVNLASLYWFQSRYGEAEPLFVRALEVLESQLGASHPETVTARITLARLYQSQRRYGEAEPLYVRALEICETELGASHWHTATALINLASLRESQGRYREAEPLYVRALKIQESVLGVAHPETATSLNDLAVLYYSEGRYEEAESLYLRALEILESVHGDSHPDVATSLNNLADLLFLSDGRWPAAEAVLVRAVEICESRLGESHPGTARSRHGLARLRLAQGRHSEALALHLRCLDGGQSRVEHELLLAASDRRLSIAGTQTSGVELALADWSAHADPKPPFDRVYRRICAWKGVALRNTARISRQIRVAMESDPDLLKLRTDLIDLEGQLSALAYAERIEDADSHLKSIAELRERRNRVQWEIQSRLGLAPERQATDGAGLARVLPKGGAVLDFLIHRRYVPRVVEDGEMIQKDAWQDPRVLCVVTTPDGSEPLPIDLGDAVRLREAVDAWLDRVVPGRRGASAQAVAEALPGETVREVLFDPILALLPADTTRLFVIPDDFLGAVPFEALPFGEGHFLVDAVDVVYATDPVSLRDLLEATRDPIDAPPSILAIGGVDYESRGDTPAAVDARSLARAELRAGPTTFARRWDPLASTSEEVDGLAARAMRTWLDADTPMVLKGGAATEEAVKSLAPGRTILHFATHGFFQREGLKSVWEAALDRANEPREPRGLGMLMGSSGRRGRDDPFAGKATLEGEEPGMLAGLILAGGNLDPTLDRDRDDGVLTATEVSSLDLSDCEVAVLSACQTSVGLRRSGEGLQSLRRAFHEAGAHSVVASLWKVDDAATQRLMHAFYEELWTNGRGPGEALRRAKQALKREGMGPDAWGAFTLSGNWR